MAEEQPKPPESKEKKKNPNIRPDCPSCHHRHPAPTTQCERCGIIFAKWKDPQQKAADAKLAALASSHSQGIPGWIKLSLFLVILAPIVIFGIPDIRTRLFGLKLRYHPDKLSEYTHKGVLDFSISIPDHKKNQNILLDRVRLETKILLTVLDTDSGGNARYKKEFKEASLEYGLSRMEFAEAPAQDLDTWQKTWKMNARGENILTTENKTDIPSFRPSRRPSDISSPKTAKKTGSPTSSDQIKRGIVSPLNLSTFFIYPKEKIRPGFQWAQTLHWEIFSPHFSLPISGEKPFRMIGYERNSTGYHAIVEWEWPDQKPDIEKPVKSLRSFFRNATTHGTIRGKAWIHTDTGMISRWKGEFVIDIDIAANNLTPLADVFAVEMGSLPSEVSTLQIKGTQTVELF